jgi:SurA N-terminal domain
VRSILQPRLTATAIAGVAVLGLSACSAGPGAAATVGDKEISVAHVQDQMLEIQQIYGPEAASDGAQLQRSLINREVVHLLLEDLAAEHDVEVTGAEVDNFLERVGTGEELEQVRETNLFTEDMLRLAARDQLLATKLAQKLGGQQQLADAVEARSEELGVTVNRRYGTWTGIDLEATAGSIASEPVETNE